MHPYLHMPTCTYLTVKRDVNRCFCTYLKLAFTAGSHEVRGSIPLCSTINFGRPTMDGFFIPGDSQGIEPREAPTAPRAVGARARRSRAQGRGCPQGIHPRPLCSTKFSQFSGIVAGLLPFKTDFQPAFTDQASRKEGLLGFRQEQLAVYKPVLLAEHVEYDGHI